MGRKEIDDAVRVLLREQGAFTSRDLSERTGRTRQALHRHLSRLVEGGSLVREGRARGTRYRPPGGPLFERTHPIDSLQEDEVWRELRDWLAGSAAEPTAETDAVLQYVVTEIVNNAIEHSGAPTVTLRAVLEGDRIRATVADEGIGALESLRSRLGFDDFLHALQELSKGKVTTMPEQHTGEGIFFVSKMVARFELVANGLAWIVDNELPDQAVRDTEECPGTVVHVEISLSSRIAPEEVFARYTHDFEFDTTRCVVRLFEYGVRFVSRSEAKRLLSGLERFREVILDFRGVEGVGQGFVDEVFRVWATAHPDVRLVPEAMSASVEFMVRRGLGRP